MAHQKLIMNQQLTYFISRQLLIYMQLEKQRGIKAQPRAGMFDANYV